jgi:hypothetical protein
MIPQLMSGWRRRMRLIGREPVLLGLLMLAAAFFVYRWMVDPSRPGAAYVYGWYGWFDQSSYLREAQLLGHVKTIPTDQFIYGPGYPLLASPFARTNDIGWPFHDPFFIPNLAVWLLTIATTFVVSRRLYGQLVAVATALALIVGTPIVNLVVVPWNTTAVLGALMMTLLVGLTRNIRWWHGAILGAAVALAYSARYVDALWIGGVALTILLARRAALRSPAWVAAGLLGGGLLIALPTFYLQWKAFGSPLKTTYTYHQLVGRSTFRLEHIWPNAVRLFVNGRAAAYWGAPLLSSMFLLVFAPIGLAQTIRASSGARRLLIVGTVASSAAAVVFYLSYFYTAGVQYGSAHFLKMWLPLWTICGVWGAFVTFRALVRVERFLEQSEGSDAASA